MKARAYGVFVIPLLGLLLLSMGGLQVLALPNTDDSPNMAAIDVFVEGEMRAARVPGLALAIVHNERVIKVRGYGSAGPSGSVVTPQTPFAVGSVGASITALAIMQLCEAGALRIDDPVQCHVPWFHVADPAASAQITIRHLLNHTSGLSALAGRSLDTAKSDRQTLTERVQALQSVRLAHQPGAVCEYSTANDQVLALIVEVVSGQSYDSYIEEHILSPLEMEHTYTSCSEAQQAGLAVGHRLILGLAVRTGLPARRHCLAASAEDLAHFMLAQLNQGRYGDRSLLSPQSMREIRDLAVPTGADAGSSHYSLGWMAGRLEETPTLTATGDEPGYYAGLALLPEEGWGVAILANANSALGPGKDRLTALPLQVLSRLRRRSPPPTTFKSTGTWLLLLALAGTAIVVQILSTKHFVAGLRRPGHSPTALGRRPLGRIVTPPALCFVLALTALVGVPTLAQVPLDQIVLVQPDLAYPLVANGVIALLRGGLYSTYALWFLWRARHSKVASVRFGPAPAGEKHRRSTTPVDMAVPNNGSAQRGRRR